MIRESDNARCLDNESCPSGTAASSAAVSECVLLTVIEVCCLHWLLCAADSDVWQELGVGVPGILQVQVVLAVLVLVSIATMRKPIPSGPSSTLPMTSVQLKLIAPATTLFPIRVILY